MAQQLRGDLSVTPVKHAEYEYPQSEHEHLPKLPMRTCMLGPGGVGKTILIANLILKQYRGCWQRIYIFSPSIHLDPVWSSVRKYIDSELRRTTASTAWRTFTPSSGTSSTSARRSRSTEKRT